MRFDLDHAPWMKCRSTASAASGWSRQAPRPMCAERSNCKHCCGSVATIASASRGWRRPDTGAGAPGVLRLVSAHYAVRWLLHQGATRHRVPHAELSFKGDVDPLRRTQAPISGLSPQSGPDVDDGGFVSCSKPVPALGQRGLSIGVLRAWSSAETRSTLLTTAPSQLALPWNAHPALSLSRQARKCQGPRGNGHSSGRYRIRRADLSSNKTVLEPDRSRLPAKAVGIAGSFAINR